MRVFMKKAACLLSSAVLLCGATAISASAANASSLAGFVSTSSTISEAKFYLSSGDFEIGDNTTKGVWVKRSSSYEMPVNSTATYQWYKDGTAISGATNYLYNISSTGKYYCKVTVKTPHTLINRRTGKKTIYTTEVFDTNTINVTQALTLTEQTGNGQLDKNGWYYMSVTVKGGTAPYTYEWTRDGNSYAANNAAAVALYAGTYKCKITDANGNTVTSKEIIVKYPDVKIDDYTKSLLFNSAYGKNQTKKITVKASGGYGKYVYFLEKKNSNGGWKEVAYSYTPEFELKYEDINDNYEYTWHQPYYRDGKWHYRGTSSNTNYYRVHVRGYGANGEIVGCVDSGEITVIRENGEEDSFTSDFYYD